MLDYSLELIEKRLKERLLDELTRSGLLFRLFSRVKDQSSIFEKFERKNYEVDGDLMQDLFGFRITSYFIDDVKIVVELCQKIFEKVELIYDEPEIDVFRPLRKNMICRLPADLNSTFEEFKAKNEKFNLIDNTFEIQFRTTLSEGWHEVDHLMRYKCKSDWVDLNNESRMLNGIYATLETNDQALKALFDDISYQHYKAKRWESMIRNQFRLRFTLQPLDLNIVNYLNENPDIGKRIFKLNRKKIIDTYLNSSLTLPITFNSFVYFVNYCYLKDQILNDLTPLIFLEELDLSITEEKINK
jgi:ppGpp synthetase/RelA/SpoT-type nucleotidyltranferase